MSDDVSFRSKINVYTLAMFVSFLGIVVANDVLRETSWLWVKWLIVGLAAIIIACGVGLIYTVTTHFWKSGPK